jgi:hypothetical protein
MHHEFALAATNTPDLRAQLLAKCDALDIDRHIKAQSKGEPVFIRTKFGVGEVGPHETQAARLMLIGTKPLADLSDAAVHTTYRPELPEVEILKEAAAGGLIGGYLQRGHDYVFYQHGQENNAHELMKPRAGLHGHVISGKLLGYTKADLAAYVVNSFARVNKFPKTFYDISADKKSLIRHLARKGVPSPKEVADVMMGKKCYEDLMAFNARKKRAALNRNA